MRKAKSKLEINVSKFSKKFKGNLRRYEEYLSPIKGGSQWEYTLFVTFLLTP